MRVHELDREAERLARRQHGVMHRDQVRSLGFTPKMVFHRIRSKAWIRLTPPVYALSSHPATWQRQYKAAELTTPNSAIGGFAGAHLLGWDGFATAKPEVVASHTTNHRNSLAVVRRNADVKTTKVHGFESQRTPRRCVT